MKTYKKLARTISARNNCIKSNNQVWFEKHQDTIDSIMSNALSGAGTVSDPLSRYDIVSYAY